LETNILTSIAAQGSLSNAHEETTPVLYRRRSLIC